MSIRENYPDFITTTKQISYYQGTYDKLVENEVVLQTQDSFALGLMAVNLALVDIAMADIELNGVNIEVQGDRNRVTKPNPANNVLKDAQTNLRFLLKEFRMSPNSRGKDLVVNKGVSDGFDDV